MRDRVLILVLFIFFLVAGCSFQGPRQGEDFRIISLAPNITEILFELGLGKNIVGVTSYCNYPEDALSIKKVGTFSEPNIEKIISLSPDLVLATSLEQQATVDKLRKLGLDVVVVYPSNLEELFDSIRGIGKITQAEVRAEQLIARMEERIRNIKQKVARIPEDRRKKVFVEIWYDPITTAGPGSYVDELIRLAGGINIAGDLARPYSRFSPEFVIARNPDAIILGYMSSSDQGKDEVIKRFGWGNISAVKNGEVYSDINPDLFLRPGPRLVEGLKEIYERLYGKKQD